MQLNIPLCDVQKCDDSDNELARFANDGYLIYQSLIPSELIDKLIEWSRSRFWDDTGKLLHCRLLDEWASEPAVKELATMPDILDILCRLYGRNPIPFQTLNFPVGTQQRTHSDTIHFHSVPQRFMAGVWVALENIHDSNGPLHYYPGSHRLPVLDCCDVGIDDSKAPDLPPSEIYGPQHYQLYEDAISELIEVAGLEKRVLIAEKGDVLIWAANLLHGGEPVLDSHSTRLSQVTHYYFEGCRFYTPLLSDKSHGNLMFREGVVDITTGTQAIQAHRRN